MVRTFTEERDRPALIVVDQRMSMFFGSVRSFKSAVAAELGALAAWMVFNAGDRVGALVFNDQRIDSIAPLRSRNWPTLLSSGWNACACSPTPTPC